MRRMSHYAMLYVPFGINPNFKSVDAASVCCRLTEREKEWGALLDLDRGEVLLLFAGSVSIYTEREIYKLNSFCMPDISID